MDDPDDFRDQARAKWDEAATGWEKRRAAFQRAMQPVSMWLVERVAPQPGYTILELAAGPADTGLLAAELVLPGGRVILTDTSEQMVEVAKRRAEELGIRNVEARQMDAEWMDAETASVDGVICRFGYMLLADPGAAFQETRRILRPGGRVTLAVWAAFEENPWTATISTALKELGLVEPAPEGEPGPFAFAAPGTVERYLEDAGFDDIVVRPLDTSFVFESADAHFEHQRDMSPTLRSVVPRLSPADHTRLRDAIDEKLAPYVRADGSVELPARVLVAAATA